MFGKNAAKADGLQSWCKACRSDYYRYTTGQYVDAEDMRTADTFTDTTVTLTGTTDAINDIIDNWQYQVSNNAIYKAVEDTQRKIEKLQLMATDKASNSGITFAYGMMFGAVSFLILEFLIRLAIR